MSNQYGPRIVTDGLVLYLDAGNTKSYPGVGNTLYDLSGNNYNGTLINSPTYTSQNRGGFILNGSNQKITTTLPTNFIGNTCGACIFCSLTNFTINTSTSNRLISVDRTSGSTKWAIGVNQLGKFQFGGGGGLDGEPSFDVPFNVPFFIAMNLNNTSYQLYLNNNLMISDTSNPSAESFDNVAIGGRPVTGDRSWIGNIYSILIYNTPITANTILQNYNALKGRFQL